MKNTVTRQEPGAGHPFLSFLNTVADDAKTRRINTFQNATVLTRQLAGMGLDAGEHTLSQAQLHAVLLLRETAYAAFSAIAAGRAPGREDMLLLQSSLKSALSDAEFDIGANGLATRASPVGGLHDLLVLSMDDLLRSDQFPRLRECRRCTHLFLDQGRGVGRRWCSMSRCGNRAKAEAFRARHKAAA